MVKKIALLALALCLTFQYWTVLPTFAFAADDDQNLGFESMLDGWTSYGDVTVEAERTVVASTNTWLVQPHGEKMAVLTPSGETFSVDSLKGVMGLSDTSVDYINSIFSAGGSSEKDITNVAYIYRDIQMAAGEETTMSWNYVATDYEPWNDASLICVANVNTPNKLPIINGYYADVCILGATVHGTGNYSTGSYGSTGWQTITVKAASAGTYRFGFVVFNLGDKLYSPLLFLEDLPGTTKLNGNEFLPIDPDDNPPPMQPVISLNYDKITFAEATTNDGTIDDISTITLTNDTFTGDIGDPVADVTFKKTPSGLTPSVIKTGDHTAELHFDGKATAHSNRSDISNFEVIFGNRAFVGGDASLVLGADTSFLAIDFNNASFTVNFYDIDGKLLKTELVEEESAGTPPNPPEIMGYHFQRWSKDYASITKDTSIKAIYAPNTDTPYLVNYYVPNTNGDGYVVKEKDHLTGTTDDKVAAAVKKYAGLELATNQSTLSGIIAPDGSLVLSVYYTEAITIPDTGDTSGATWPWLLAGILSAIGIFMIWGIGRSKSSSPKKN